VVCQEKHTIYVGVSSILNKVGPSYYIEISRLLGEIGGYTDGGDRGLERQG
jgi:hypothetical protein